jgi:hypothetical protein
MRIAIRMLSWLEIFVPPRFRSEELGDGREYIHQLWQSGAPSSKIFRKTLAIGFWCYMNMFVTTIDRKRVGVISKPPANTLKRAIRFLTTAKGFREVFEPTFSDMDVEYFEALSRKEYFEARKIVIACHLRVGMLMVARPVVRAVATVFGWVKVG